MVNRHFRGHSSLTDWISFVVSMVIGGIIAVFHFILSQKSAVLRQVSNRLLYSCCEVLINT